MPDKVGLAELNLYEMIGRKQVLIENLMRKVQEQHNEIERLKSQNVPNTAGS